MIILSLRTDKPEAEIGLFEKNIELAYEVWQAHRALAETIHAKIDEILNKNNKSLKEVNGIVVYSGPGSFTGLRIGLATANALAYGLEVPIVGIEGEEKWLQKGLEMISLGQNDKAVMPAYGSPVHITTPKK
jgi:tRNA threonylcarbamoyladenosine biosynthesis protein TsaB